MINTESLKYLEGRKLCIVFCKLNNEEEHKKSGKDPEQGEFQISTMHGIAYFADGKHLALKTEGGTSFTVPASAYKNIHPNDGTEILKDSESFVMVKVSGMDLA